MEWALFFQALNTFRQNHFYFMIRENTATRKNKCKVSRKGHSVCVCATLLCNVSGRPRAQNGCCLPRQTVEDTVHRKPTASVSLVVIRDGQECSQSQWKLETVFHASFTTPQFSTSSVSELCPQKTRCDSSPLSAAEVDWLLQSLLYMWHVLSTVRGH